jgi:alpha-L-rhamnosidase
MSFLLKLKGIRKEYYLTLIIMLFFSISGKAHEAGILDLRCEYIDNPIGIDTPSPRFSWKISADQRGVFQKAYQIIVGEKMDEVNGESGKCWDSGIIKSDQTVNIEYGGISLRSDQKYFWRVRVWTNEGQTKWSKTAIFHTGLFNRTDWQSQWITTDDEIIHASPILRKEFVVKKKIKQAVAFVSACGYYEFYLNGKKVGDHVLDPAITNYRKTVLYSTYDVSKLLKNGNNVTGAMLGNGAYNVRAVNGRYNCGGNSFGNPCYIMQINITYSDGSQSVITTDKSWKYFQGPITYNNLYGGEDYDAEKEVKGWASEGFNDKDWKNVIFAQNPGGVLKSQLMSPIKIVATVHPVSEINVSPGVYLFDLGQNIAGWWLLHLKGKTGETIRVRGAETLNDSLFPKPLEKGDKLSIKFEYHSHVWTDYTMKDNNEEVYEPRFFYTGFRYIEVTTSDKKDLDYLKVEGRVVHSALEKNGSFESSDSIINMIHLAGLWSQMANTFGYPTDCPHREKGAYCGDGEVIAETSIHDFQMAQFYTKWLNDMSDSQESNGRIPNTSPTLVGGTGGGIAWGSAYILIPWWMYNYYHDVRVLKEHYSGMKKYIQYLEDLGRKDDNSNEPYIINNFGGYWDSLGEWCAPGQRDCPNHPVVNTFYYYYDVLLMSKIAEILGNDIDGRHFLALSDTIKNAFNKKFFNTQTCLYGTEKTYQTYQLLALAGNIVPDEYRSKVLNTIVEDINQRDGHLNTGIIGTKYLWPMLVRGNYGNLAFKVATQRTYPSYGYWLKNGSTTLLEEWSGENSQNHQMFGSISEYFYKYLAGIQSPVEGNTTVGYNHLQLQPFVPDKLQWVNSTLETVAGTIVSNWKREKNFFQYHVSIPANTTALVILPVFDVQNITVSEGNSVIWKDGSFVKGVSGISDVKAGPEQIKVSVKSGDYNFTLIEERK